MSVKWTEGVTVTGYKAYRLLLAGMFGPRRRDYWKFKRMARKTRLTWVDVSSVPAKTSNPATITLDNRDR